MIRRHLILAVVVALATALPAVKADQPAEIRFTFDDPRQMLPNRAGSTYTAINNAAAAGQLREIIRAYGKRGAERLVWIYPAGDGQHRAAERVAALMVDLELTGGPVLRAGRGFGSNWLSVQKADRAPLPPANSCGWWLELDDPRLPGPANIPLLAIAPGTEISVPPGARYRIQAPDRPGKVTALGNRVLGRSETWLADPQRPLVLSLRPDQPDQVAAITAAPGGGKDRGAPVPWDGVAVRADACHVRLLPAAG